MNEVYKFYSDNIKCWLDNPRYVIRHSYLNMLGDVSGKRIIDIGCGCGQDMLILSKKYSGIDGVGLDFCENSLKEASHLLKDYRNWKLVHNDMMNYESAQKFDIVIFSMIVMHYPNLSVIFKKISSLMNPGGRLLLVTNNPYLICKEYDVQYPEGEGSVSYQHHFFYQGKELKIIKYVHSISSYINCAYSYSLNVEQMLEQAVYSQETQFFNPIPNLDMPNFISILYMLS